MNIFTHGSYRWWQVGLLKLSVLSIGIAIGANWPAIFLPYTTMLIGLGIVLGLYLGFAWFRNS